MVTYRIQKSIFKNEELGCSSLQKYFTRTQAMSEVIWNKVDLK
jgi:hypothetical protein